MTTLLLRGLKFTPTPKYSNISQLQSDVKTLSRSLKLTEYFYDKENNDNSLLSKKSSWVPFLTRDRQLDECCRRLSRLADSLEDESMTYAPPNLSSSELHALTELTNLVKEKKLWITESDKGGFICLFDPDYIGQIGHRLLEDRGTFEPVDDKCEKRTLAAI